MLLVQFSSLEVLGDATSLRVRIQCLRPRCATQSPSGPSPKARDRPKSNDFAGTLGFGAGKGFTRRPENSERAHLRAPALQTPPEKTPKRGKEENCGRRGLKKPHPWKANQLWPNEVWPAPPPPSLAKRRVQLRLARFCFQGGGRGILGGPGGSGGACLDRVGPGGGPGGGRSRWGGGLRASARRVGARILGPELWGLQGVGSGEPNFGPRRVGGNNFRAFPSAATVFFLSSLSWGIIVEFWCFFEPSGPSNVHVWSSRV